MGAVSTAFVKQYKDMIIILVQQRGSKLRGTVELDTNFVGEFKFYDQIGSTAMVQKTSRNQDTPSIDPNHQRRRITKQDWIHNVLLDKEDQLNMIVDPKSSYARTAMMAAGRTIDDRIINAFNADAFSGQDGGTTETFDASNQIAHGSTGMTKAKVLQAKRLLDNKDVEEDNRFMVVAPQQIEDLLNTTEVASSDFNTVKALVEGTVDTWIGFKWIWLTRLGVTTTIRRTYAYHRSAIQLAIQKEPSVRIDERPDKNYAWQVFLSLSLGATRLEEERIVEISCQES